MTQLTLPAVMLDAPASIAFDLRDCEELMRGGSRSFFAASRVLPERVRLPAVALYAFCRVADDAIDLHPEDHDAVRRLLQRLDAIDAGRPSAEMADRAMACVMREFGIPRALPAALIDGFAWDAAGRRYDTLDDLLDYCARVAGTVGAMMALIMGVRDATALARACELGCAMQLTNIARDVGEDARNGRLYLPRQWMRDAGLDPDAWLAAPAFDPRLASVVGRVLDAADALYHRAEHGVHHLPRDCRPAIQAAHLVYAEIGRQLRRAGLDSVSRRTVVSGSRKLQLMLRASGAALVAPGRGRAPLDALPAVGFLVEASRQAIRRGGLATASRPSRGLDDRLGWMIELFERQQMRDRATYGG